MTYRELRQLIESEDEVRRARSATAAEHDALRAQVDRLGHELADAERVLAGGEGMLATVASWFRGKSTGERETEAARVRTELAIASRRLEQLVQLEREHAQKLDEIAAARAELAEREAEAGRALMRAEGPLGAEYRAIVAAIARETHVLAAVDDLLRALDRADAAVATIRTAAPRLASTAHAIGQVATRDIAPTDRAVVRAQLHEAVPHALHCLRELLAATEPLRVLVPASARWLPRGRLHALAITRLETPAERSPLVREIEQTAACFADIATRVGAERALIADKRDELMSQQRTLAGRALG